AMHNMLLRSRLPLPSGERVGVRGRICESARPAQPLTLALSPEGRGDLSVALCGPAARNVITFSISILKNVSQADSRASPHALACSDSPAAAYRCARHAVLRAERC